MLKRTHTNCSFKSPLLPPLPPPFIITLLQPHCGPLGHLPPACLRLFTLLEREGPERGQWRLSQRLSTPWLSEEVCKGASQHPFHKLHSLPPHFLPTLTCLTHSQIHTLFLCLPPTSQNVALRSTQCTPVGAHHSPRQQISLRAVVWVMFHPYRTLSLVLFMGGFKFPKNVIKLNNLFPCRHHSSTIKSYLIKTERVVHCIVKWESLNFPNYLIC